MAKLKIENIDGLEGEYEFDPSYFTNRELHLIKRETGIRAGELQDAVEAGDNDLVVTLAYIALLRAGKKLPNADMLWDASAGTITLDLEEEGEAEGPPSPPPSGLGNDDTDSEPRPTSGDGS